MKEKKLYKPFVSNAKNKKYSVYVKGQNGKPKLIHFGDKRYQQFRDRTPLHLYSKKNHGERSRLRNYYSRHSGVKTRKAGIKKERRHAHGLYTPKLLSHIYLW